VHASGRAKVSMQPVSGLELADDTNFKRPGHR
jgi:hypothetical protein